MELTVPNRIKISKNYKTFYKHFNFGLECTGSGE